MERIDKRCIELEHRLPPGHDNIGPATADMTPTGSRSICKAVRIGELPPAGAIRTHKVGVTKLADRVHAVLLAPAPEVATRKPQKDCAPAGLDAFSLQRQEHFLYCGVIILDIPTGNPIGYSIRS